MKKTLLLPALLALSLPALAGRPLATEDANTLDDGACQLESWANRTSSNVTEFNAVPACAFLKIETQLGTRWTHESGSTRTAGQFFQMKHAFKKVSEGDWGVGLVAGVTRDRLRETKNDWGDAYFIVPFSFGVGADKESRWLVHLNAGNFHNRAESRNVTLWGVAVEKPVTENFTALGEVYGENAKNPFWRVGGRYTVIADHLSVDLTYVGRSGGTSEDRLWSLGFHLEGEVFK